jgi:putative membrane protein
MSVIIPGLTSSSIMMALGLYQPMMDGLARMDLWVLSATLPGMILAIILLSRFVNWFLEHHYSAAFHGILGIVLASTLVIIPSDYPSFGEIALSAICCIIGFLLAFLLARLDQKTKE